MSSTIISGTMICRATPWRPTGIQALAACLAPIGPNPVKTQGLAAGVVGKKTNAASTKRRQANP
jgi:hypothetical protein